MSLKLGKPKMPPSEPRKDEERETREAVVQDADKTEGRDRDLVTAMAGRSVSKTAKIRTRTIGARFASTDSSNRENSQAGRA